MVAERFVDESLARGVFEVVVRDRDDKVSKVRQIEGPRRRAEAFELFAEDLLRVGPEVTDRDLEDVLHGCSLDRLAAAQLHRGFDRAQGLRDLMLRRAARYGELAGANGTTDRASAELQRRDVQRDIQHREVCVGVRENDEIRVVEDARQQIAEGVARQQGTRAAIGQVC